MSKCYRLADGEIRPLAMGKGSCIASDQITVHGHKVGYMVRYEPVAEADSGWVFFAGNETEEYTADKTNFEIYDINTVANYDSEIIDLLDTAAPCAFERGFAGGLVPVVKALASS